jgi:hypothetical protein
VKFCAYTCKKKTGNTSQQTIPRKPPLPLKKKVLIWGQNKTHRIFLICRVRHNDAYAREQAGGEGALDVRGGLVDKLRQLFLVGRVKEVMSETCHFR